MTMEESSRRLKTSRGRQLALAVFGPTVLLLGMELLLRVAGLGASTNDWPLPGFHLVPDAESGGESLMMRHPTRFFAATPNFEGIAATDANGFRGGSHPARHANLVRVALIGDSCTMGFGVHYGDSFVGRLADQLRRRAPTVDVDVVNAGCSGYSTVQNRIDLDERVLPMRPDVVVFAITGWNDAGAAIGRDDLAWRRFLDAPSPLEVLRSHSRLVGGLDRLIHGTTGGVLAGKEELAAARSGARPHGPRVERSDFLANVTGMIDATVAAGGRPIVLLLRQREDTLPDQPYPASYLEAAREILVGRDLPILDSADLLPERDRRFYLDAIHPNEVGHRIVADALVPIVAEELGIASIKLASTEPLPTIDALDPRVADAFGKTRVVVRGTRFEVEDEPRFWVAGSPAKIELLSAVEARLILPPLPYGLAEVVVQTHRGSARSADRIDVKGPELRLERVPDGWTILVSGPVGAQVSILTGTSRREERRSFGRLFGIDPATAPPGLSWSGVIGDDGWYRLAIPYQGTAEPPPLYLQALVTPPHGSPRVGLYSSVVSTVAEIKNSALDPK